MAAAGYEGTTDGKRTPLGSCPLALIGIFCAANLLGCQSLDLLNRKVAPPASGGAIETDAAVGRTQYVACRSWIDPAACAEEAKQARGLAADFETRGQPQCVDQYYRASILAWRSIEGELTTTGASGQRPAA